jgi:hypothetical protein
MFGPHIRVVEQGAWRRACKLAHGSYQRRLLHGWQSLSGADLKGRARSWARRYEQSRESFLVRCRKAGIAIGEETADHGLRRLVVGDPEICYQLGNNEKCEFVAMQSH